MPAALVLLDSYKRLESASYNYEFLREKQYIEQIWVKEAVEGRWYDTLMNSANSFITEFSKNVTGKIEYKISINGIILNKMSVPSPRYCKIRTEDSTPLYLQNIDKIIQAA